MHSRNNRYMSNRPRINSQTRINNQTLLMRHFENITTLTRIIENSQRLLDSNRQPYSNRFSLGNDSDNLSEHSNFILRFDSLFPNMLNSESNDVQPVNDISYNIFNINEHNVSMIDSSNTHIDLYDILSFNLISSPINETCPITQESFDLSENVFMIKSCKHIFNKSALQQWIRTNNTCPSCRTLIHNTLPQPFSFTNITSQPQRESDR